MATKPPTEEELDPNEQVIEISFIDGLMISLGYLWFMRRVLVGAILISGLGYIIYSTYAKSREKLDEHKSAPAYVAESNEPDLPGANGELASSYTDDSSSAGVSSVDLLNPQSSPDYVTAELNSSGGIDANSSVEAKEFKSVSYDPMLENGTADELIDLLLVLKESWVGQLPSPVYLVNKRRTKLARRLMELDDDVHRQVFALNEYIEAMLILDLLVIQHDIESPDVRAAVEEIAQKYQEHESPTIRGKACLASVVMPLHDYFAEKKAESTELLELFAKRLDSLGDEVFQDEIASSRLFRLVMLLREHHEWDGVALPYCEKLIEKMAASSDSEVVTMGENLRERVYFQHLGVNDLVSRLDQGDEEVTAEIDEFFTGLEMNPNLRLGFYQIAVSIIVKHKELELRERYEALMERLAKITETVESEDQKAEIVRALLELDELHWGEAKDDAPKVNIESSDPDSEPPEGMPDVLEEEATQ